MVSLEPFPNLEPKTPPAEQQVWATGKLAEKPKPNLWTPKTPKWHLTGEPVKQKYALTQLKLSNVRLNDQLLPRPQDCEMGKLMIDLPFPAEHPYSSHMSRFDVFPTFDMPEDAKRGFTAREDVPKNSEMPSQPYDVTIVRKVKGNAFRHEIQALPPESEKKALHWHDGDKFDQLVKSPWGGQQNYYPVPPKMFHPNLDQRDDNKVYNGNMEVSANTANTTRNVERDQWQTTYDITHTGLGPANPNDLDNLEVKQHRKDIVGITSDEDVLHPLSVRTFDPARPVEGRIAKALVPDPKPQTNHWPNPETDPAYHRKMTLTEKEEERLWNGQVYQNLPEHDHGEQWCETNLENHPESGIERLEEALRLRPRPDEVPYPPANASGATEVQRLGKLKHEQHQIHQQVEAQNRWKLLELQTPSKNIAARNRKMSLQVDKSQPQTFYQHEGTYNRERAGLYKTSYDPYSLQHAMKKDQGSSTELFYTMDSHKDVLNGSHDINNQMATLMQDGRTLGNPGSVPQLSEQAAPHEVFGPYASLRSLQQLQLQPQFNQADVQTQEKGILTVDSTYGDSYNTPKFLQENSLPAEARKEPLLLMSKDNQSLRNTRKTTVPKTPRSIKFNGDLVMASGAGGEPIRLTSAPINGLKTAQFFPDLRPESSSGLPSRALQHVVEDGHGAALAQTQKNKMYNSLPIVLLKAKPVTCADRINSADLLVNRSLHVGSASTGGQLWNTKSSYAELFPGNNHVDLSFKKDSRFDWMPGSGKPRPQSDLLMIQDSFSKSQARKRFHDKFPENNPDLRENIILGKKHVFIGGINAQVLRGTPVLS